MKAYKLAYVDAHGQSRIEWLSSDISARKRRVQLKREIKTATKTDLRYEVEEVEIPIKKAELLVFLNSVTGAPAGFVEEPMDDDGVDDMDFSG
jgi:hypothetical protein